MVKRGSPLSAADEWVAGFDADMLTETGSWAKGSRFWRTALPNWWNSVGPVSDIKDSREWTLVRRKVKPTTILAPAPISPTRTTQYTDYFQRMHFVAPAWNSKPTIPVFKEGVDLTHGKRYMADGEEWVVLDAFRFPVGCTLRACWTVKKHGVPVTSAWHPLHYDASLRAVATVTGPGQQIFLQLATAYDSSKEITPLSTKQRAACFNSLGNLATCMAEALAIAVTITDAYPKRITRELYFGGRATSGAPLRPNDWRARLSTRLDTTVKAVAQVRDAKKHGKPDLVAISQRLMRAALAA
jgi:hypothetical protein